MAFKAVTSGISETRMMFVSKPAASFARFSSLSGAAQPLTVGASRRLSRARQGAVVLARASTETKPEIAKVCLLLVNDAPPFLYLVQWHRST